MPRARFSILVASLWALGPGALGCAGQVSETERQLQRVQERVAILQNERDRLDERVTALEQQQDLAQRDRSAVQARSETQRPPLKVVRLEPELEGGEPRQAATPKEATQVVQSPEVDAPRVLISGSGDKLTATQVTGGTE